MKIYSNRLMNLKAITTSAFHNHYAVGHFNINNFEWAKALIQIASETRTPLIIGVSEGCIKYMGGYDTVVNIIENLLEHYDIKTQVVLHLDHGQSYESAEKAIQSGFSSVMIDGSHLSLAENIKVTKKVVELATQYEVSVEAEVGSIGGQEDGVASQGELADSAAAIKMKATGIDILAAGIGNIHGKYPKDWAGLSFTTLKSISEAAQIPMVLHGGSGIPKEQVQRSIKMGISKINVNTECQLAFCQALEQYFHEGRHHEKKGYDPRNILAFGAEAIKKTFVELTKEFGCYNKSK